MRRRNLTRQEAQEWIVAHRDSSFEDPQFEKDVGRLGAGDLEAMGSIIEDGTADERSVALHVVAQLCRDRRVTLVRPRRTPVQSPFDSSVLSAIGDVLFDVQASRSDWMAALSICQSGIVPFEGGFAHLNEGDRGYRLVFPDGRTFPTSEILASDRQHISGHLDRDDDDDDADDDAETGWAPGALRNMTLTVLGFGAAAAAVAIGSSWTAGIVSTVLAVVAGLLAAAAAWSLLFYGVVAAVLGWVDHRSGRSAPESPGKS